jgi:uncharacterized protein
MNEISQDEKTMAMLGHLSSLSGLIIPFGTIIGPLVVWLIKKDTMPFASEQAKEALNFNITMFLVFIVGFILTFVIIGLFVLLAAGIAWLVLTIMAGLEANKGNSYKYPFTLRLVN